MLPKPTEFSPESNEMDLPTDDRLRQYDFKEGDVCLNVVYQWPPDLPEGYEAIGAAGTVFTIRDHNGTLGMIAGDRGNIVRSCWESGLTIRTLH